MSVWSKDWGCGNGRAATATKEGFVRFTGEGREDWVSGSALTTVPSVFETDMLHPAQEGNSQSPSRGN